MGGGGTDRGRFERALPGVHTFESEVSDPEAIAALHERVTTQFPALGTLVNNAGVMRNQDLNQDRDLNGVTRKIDVNLSGPLRMVQRFLPHLESRDGALIVNVSSGLAFVPFLASPINHATKSAVDSFSLCLRVLRVQLGGTGVTVVELAPPPFETKLFRSEFEAEARGQKAMDPAVLVRQAIAGIEAGRLEVRPSLANVLKAMSRIAPRLMLRQLAGMAEPRIPTSGAPR